MTDNKTKLVTSVWDGYDVPQTPPKPQPNLSAEAASLSKRLSESSMGKVMGPKAKS